MSQKSQSKCSSLSLTYITVPKSNCFSVDPPTVTGSDLFGVWFALRLYTDDVCLVDFLEAREIFLIGNPHTIRGDNQIRKDYY